MTRPAPSRRLWTGLGSPNAIRIIFIGMIVYFLVIGGLVLGYLNVQDCLRTYSDQNAAALNVRAQASAEEAATNARAAVVDQSDRTQIIATQAATRKLILATLTNNGRATNDALQEYLATNDAALKVFQKNEGERSAITAERTHIAQMRASAVLPPPPSESC